MRILKIKRKLIIVFKKRINWDLLKIKRKLLKAKIRYKVDVAFSTKNVISSNTKIDIIIPAIERDLEVLPYVIDSVRKYIEHPIMKIIVVSPDSKKIKNLCYKKKCMYVNENTVLPIKKTEIDYNVNGLDRSGWLFQQFLKWGADVLCSQKHYLVLDSDTVFIRPVVFKYKNKTIFDISDEYHKKYFDIYKRIFGYEAELPLSFTCHCMLYEKSKILELKQTIEDKYSIKWYEVIMKKMDKSDSTAHSDYETYGQYLFSHYPHEIILRYWYNLSRYNLETLRRKDLLSMKEIINKYSKKYRTVSFHYYAG